MNYQTLFKQIYEDVFCNTFNESCYVFLCGGSGKDCIRNSLRPLLEKSGYQVLYPEDLFTEMIFEDKKADLLDYENLLANNADIVCIVCESPGSFTELGAFVQKDEIVGKLIACINHRYRRNRSFIMLGPVRRLRRENPFQVVEYLPVNVEKICLDLHDSFSKLIRKAPRRHTDLSFENLLSFISYIQIVLYFFRELDRKILHKSLKDFLMSRQSLPKQYNALFNASINYLLKSRILTSKVRLDTNEESLSISNIGINQTKLILSKSQKGYYQLLHDKIRCSILKEQLKT